MGRANWGFENCTEGWGFGLYCFWKVERSLIEMRESVSTEQSAAQGKAVPVIYTR
jgi:hypothetical protein